MGYKYSELPRHIQKMVDNAGHPAPTAFQPKGTSPNPPAKVKGVQNASEKDFYVSYLSPRLATGEFYSVKYESLALPIAHRCVYNPDFIAGTKDNQTVIFEVKQPHRFREKGVIKLKVAATKYPQYSFYLAEKKKGNWSVKLVPAMLDGIAAIKLEEDEVE